MAKSYYPFSSGTGYQTSEAQWAEMARHWLRTGVIRNLLNSLEVYADATAMQVKVRSGSAFIEGYWFQSTAEEALAISAADATNPRIDRVVVRLDRAGQTIDLAVVAGTAAGSPNAPAITQTTSGVYEISLARVLVSAAVTNIAADKITDERYWANAISESANVFTGATTNDTTIATSGAPELMEFTTNPLVLNTSGGDIEVDFAASVTNSGANVQVTCRPRLDGVTALEGNPVNVSSGQFANASCKRRFTGVAAGRHTIDMIWFVGSGTGTVLDSRQLTAREIRR